MLETISNQEPSIQLDHLTRQTFNVFDKDGNNYLDFAEFLAAYIIMEKNELFSAEKPTPILPTIPALPRPAARYYSPPSRLLSPPVYPPTYPHYPQTPQRYIYSYR